MDIATRSRVCAEAGRAAHYYGTGHEWTSDGAREAARRSWAHRHRPTPEERRAQKAAEMRHWRRKRAAAGQRGDEVSPH